mmetsp:Transcript_157790/g.383153  ORF Transcript_157790/g.383153 Transcript_157790/m.383153 type:complete len:352 (+) Transcript_157790:1027-2082(+)
MHAEHFRVGHRWQRVNELHVSLVVVAVGRRRHPEPRRRVRRARFQRARVVQAVDDREQATPVLVIGHTPTVVALACQVQQRQVGNVDATFLLRVRRVVEEHGQLAHGNTKVGVVELVGNVPSQGGELPALLHEGVEEAQSKTQPAELLAVLHTTEERRVRNRIQQERALDVLLQTLRGLVCHLHTVLENRDGEVLAWVRRAPHAEVLVRVVRVQLLDDGLESGHPRHSQVTVLEHHPAALATRLLDIGLGPRTLALTQRNGSHRHLGVVGELQQLGHRVGTRRQHEHQRHRTVRVAVARRQIEWRRFQELLPHLVAHEVLNRQAHLVGTDRAQHKHLLQSSQLAVTTPFAR